MARQEDLPDFVYVDIHFLDDGDPTDHAPVALVDSDGDGLIMRLEGVLTALHAEQAECLVGCRCSHLVDGVLDGSAPRFSIVLYHCYANHVSRFMTSI